MSKYSLWKPGIILVIAICLCAVSPSSAQTFETLVSFDNSDGRYPLPPPVQARDGNLYGVTSAGGLNGAGTVYKVSPEGVLTTLYNFCSQSNCTDGEFPIAALIVGTDGNLYGTTSYGGVNFGGTIFKLTLEGALTTVYEFCSQANCADGSSPNGLLQSTDGNFYGTTNAGGPAFAGTIFKLTPRGTLTLLHTFCSQPNCADGFDVNVSFGSLIEGTDGNLYGLTDRGGISNPDPCFDGCGTAFKITHQGTFTSLHKFCSMKNCADGASPYWLIQVADGSLYGVTGEGGGNKTESGTIFRLTQQGEVRSVYRFCTESGCADGSQPFWLIQAAGNGKLYGVTFRGGSGRCHDGCGTAFEITSTGTLISLHSFDLVDGGNPLGITQATNGNFYGTTYRGGTVDYGTIFTISTGLAPFAEILPTSGKVGTKVSILGTDLTGTKSVSFHGAPATFTVVSSSEIVTSVPDGASTGAVNVTTPSGKLSSNVVFRVK